MGAARPTLFDRIPGLRDAVEAERFQRDLAFAEVPEDICGVTVVPLNWLRFIRLAVSGSPFVCGGEVNPHDVAAALWLLSPDYSPTSKWRRWLFMRRVRRIPYLKLCEGLDNYFQEALADAPGGRSREDSPSYYSAPAAQMDLFCSEYGGITPENFTRIPFKQLWQLLRCIQARHGEKVFFNPSDRIRGDWLRQQNEGQN